ncbi:MAG: hypothetical protein HY746_04990 [Elusimicrobia bacterium]|nr:hypothetical protein [Elusimicrobiota bacterium]
MKNFFDKLLKLDRRILFLLVVFVIVFPIFKPLKLPGIKITDAVKGVYNTIESLPENSVILVSFDFDPASKPELYPMAVAVLRHAFKKNLKVIGMTLWATGPGIADEIITMTAREYKKEYGKDYLYFGYQVGGYAVITGMGTDIYKIFSKDAKKGSPLETFPVMQGIKSLKNFAYVIDFGAGDPGIDTWIAYGADKFGFKLGAGCTAVNEAPTRPYLQTKQLTGLIPAMKGASEYEILIKAPDKASAGMDAIGLGHFLILFLVILANVVLIVQKYLLT